jgi:putative transposase
MAGRRVWFQYRDTPLTFEKSYYARLNYTHNNAVKHGLVQEATQYPYCSAAWFEQAAPRALYKKIESFKWDAVKVEDEYDVEWHTEKEPSG